MTEPGIYRLSISGPGILSLARFRTVDGRSSNGSERLDPLLRAGGAFEVGALPSVILEPAQTYLVQVGAAAPRSLVIEKIADLERDNARLASDAGTLALLAGQTYVLALDADARLDLTAGPDPVKVTVTTAPEMKAQARIGNQTIGQGGLFPFVPVQGDVLSVSGAGDDANPVPLLMLAVSAAPDGLDDVEPGPNDLGAVAGAELFLRGVLHLPQDRDIYSFELPQDGSFDLDVLHGSVDELLIRLEATDHQPIAELFRMTTETGRARRAGLGLSAGSYQLIVEGAPAAPLIYDVFMRPSGQTDPLSEGEPDDQPDFARVIAPGQTLLGHLTAADPDHLRFQVDQADHLWTLRAVQGVTDLALAMADGRRIGEWKAIDGAVVLPLALPPGHYVARLRGYDRYAVRLTDDGPLPDDFEREPNETEDSYQRMAIGDTLSGAFFAGGDLDVVEVITAASTPLRITLQGPDDGAMQADILFSDGHRLRAELVAGQSAVIYEVTFPVGRHLIALKPRGERISGRWQLSLDRTETPESGEPQSTVALPDDGVITGRIGGFDAADDIFVRLPQAPVDALFSCEGALQSFALRSYGDDKPLLRADAGQIGILPHDAALGGAVRLVTEAAQSVGPYQCSLFFAPVLRAFTQVAHVEDLDDGAPSLLAQDASVAGRFEEGDRRDLVTLDIQSGDRSALHCRDGAGQAMDRQRLRSAGSRALDAALRLPPTQDGMFIVVGLPDDEPVLEIRPDPQAPVWTCDLYGPNSFRSLAEMGPVAEFTALRDRGRMSAEEQAAYDPQDALAVLAGGRPDWLTTTQTTDDLDIAISVAALEVPFRAYSRLGQSATVTATLRNGANPQEVRFSATALADGWRVTVPEGLMTLGPGEVVDVPVSIEIPPFQSAVLQPSLQFLAAANGARRSLTVPVLFDPLASERSPARHWAMPSDLRGGLDPLQYRFGARIIAEDEAPLDDRRAQTLAPLHDGWAPHSGQLVSWRSRTLDFKLAEPVPIVALRLHLRTAASRASWPDRVTVLLSEDGVTWRPAFDVRPTASDLPQVFRLAQPMEAAFARVVRHGCRNDRACATTALADIGLVAAQDWRPSVPINIADMDFGGHVVLGRDLGGTDSRDLVFGGPWNSNLLRSTGPATLAQASERSGNQSEAVIAFEHTRAAKIAAIKWVGHPEDTALSARVSVDISLTGPAGPWRRIDRLPAPAQPGATGTLTLAPAQWARAVRLTFDRSETARVAIPDRIIIEEDQTAPPVNGLWEDDRADAGYEDTIAAPPAEVPQPSGGATAQAAVPLATGEMVHSSVQLERNSDWWKISVPNGVPQALDLSFAGMITPDVAVRMTNAAGAVIALTPGQTAEGDYALSAVVTPGDYRLEVFEPPRSIAILWDTSGSVASFIPRTLAAVRVWSQSLVPGRDRLQLLPFGLTEMLLDNWAETPQEVFPTLMELPATSSSDAEAALAVAAADLADALGQRGIVVFTDAETGPSQGLWKQMLAARPRVVVLSLDTSDRTGETIMKDWVSVNDGYFLRVVGQAGLSDGMDLAAALFRAPKGYRMTMALEALREPQGRGALTLALSETASADGVAPSGAIEVILDASGSMLQRLPDGQRRIAVAHDALANLVENALPAGTPFAFRAFGLQEDACRSEILLPLAPLDPSVASAAIRSVPAVNLARTAIARSLALAAEDLSVADPPLVIVLVTDGEETCDGDVAGEIARISDSGIDLRLTIVGFAIDNAELAETFAAWAALGGGQYLSAQDADGLRDTVSQSIQPRFALERLYLDGRTEAAGTIDFGATTEMPAGRYRLVPQQTAVGDPIEILVNPDRERTVIYDPATGLRPSEGTLP